MNILSSFFLSSNGCKVVVCIKGEEYEYEMATEDMASKAQWLLTHKPFYHALEWVKRMRVNERKVRNVQR